MCSLSMQEQRALRKAEMQAATEMKKKELAQKNREAAREQLLRMQAVLVRTYPIRRGM